MYDAAGCFQDHKNRRLKNCRPEERKETHEGDDDDEDDDDHDEDEDRRKCEEAGKGRETN